MTTEQRQRLNETLRAIGSADQPSARHAQHLRVVGVRDGVSPDVINLLDNYVEEATTVERLREELADAKACAKTSWEFVGEAVEALTSPDIVTMATTRGEVGA